MKRFMYLSIALLCISLAAAIAFQAGHDTAQATIVTEPVGVVLAFARNYVLTTTGEIWIWNDPEGPWRKFCDLPIPLAEVHAIDSSENLLRVELLAKNGDHWEISGGEWHNHGQPPVSPVPTKQQSWGGVKDKFNPEEKP